MVFMLLIQPHAYYFKTLNRGRASTIASFHLLQRAVNLIHEWFSTWQLNVNLEKSAANLSTK